MFFPLAMAGGREHVCGMTQSLRRSRHLKLCPLDSLTVVVFLPLLSLREGRNPTITMANQSTTRPSNPSTPKRVAKSASSQSLNHLLNFSLPPRQTHQVQSLPRRSRRHGTTQGVWNKEREVIFRFQPSPSHNNHPSTL